MKQSGISPELLFQVAETARANAYAPYSGFRVGAALLTADGDIFRGCNIENASFGATNCAERTALFSAIAAGKRDFLALAIVGYGKDAPTEDFCFPCGICRQALAEFCPPDMPVFLKNVAGEHRAFTLEELLPNAFSGERL